MPGLDQFLGLGRRVHVRLVLSYLFFRSLSQQEITGRYRFGFAGLRSRQASRRGLALWEESPLQEIVAVGQVVRARQLILFGHLHAPQIKRPVLCDCDLDVPAAGSERFLVRVFCFRFRGKCGLVDLTAQARVIGGDSRDELLDLVVLFHQLKMPTLHTSLVQTS